MPAGMDFIGSRKDFLIQILGVVLLVGFFSHWIILVYAVGRADAIF
jgi:hypothetical protein